MHELYSGNLYFRIRYVQFDNFTKFGQIYLVIGGILLLLLIGVDMYTTNHVNACLQAILFETLLVTAIVSIFVGQTNLVEESSICFIAALIWLILQTRNIVTEKKDRSVSLVLLFFPFAITTCIEPIIRIFPALHKYSLTASVVMLMVGIVTILFYQLLATKTVCK